MNYKNINIKVFSYGTILGNCSHNFIENSCFIIAEYPKIYIPKIKFSLKNLNMKYELITHEKLLAYPTYPEDWIKETLLNKFKHTSFLYVDDSPQYIRSVSNIANVFVCNFKTYLQINQEIVNERISSNGR